VVHEFSKDADVVGFKMDWVKFRATLASSIQTTAYGRYQTWYGQRLKRKLARDDSRGLVKKVKTQ